jgi:hypothetical protein
LLSRRAARAFFASCDRSPRCYAQPERLPASPPALARDRRARISGASSCAAHVARRQRERAMSLPPPGGPMTHTATKESPWQR